MKLTLRVIALILLLSALVSAFAACDYISFPEDINGTHENGGSNSAGGDESTNTGSGNNGTNSGNNNDGGNGTVEGYGSNVSGQYGNIGTKPVLSGNDPYKNVSQSEFYANYTPATSYEDAYYRSQNGLLSGTISYATGAPTLAQNRPMQDGKFVRNTREIYTLGGEAYTILDSEGNAVMTIYKCGAYIALEEVAAYVYAYGTYPPNHRTSKSTKPANSIFGKYLRVNHSQFSGDTTKYPNEPKLPNASGGGGSLQYWEMDIGGSSYNNGTKITRGAYRIVYAKKDLNGNGIYEYGELHVFYTYNHYEDFQEYLNYYGGWSDRFGYETGGKVYGKPSPYVNVYWGDLLYGRVVAVIIPYFDKKYI